MGGLGILNRDLDLDFARSSRKEGYPVAVNMERIVSVGHDSAEGAVSVARWKRLA